MCSNPALHRRAAVPGRVGQVLPEGGQLGRGHAAVGQPGWHGLVSLQHMARQRQPFAHVAGRAAQEPTAAHVGEQADARLGHGHLGALGHHAQAGALAQAHAAAHDDAVHEGDVGLAVGVDQVVERVFLGEEVAQRLVAGQRRLVEEADVAAGTKGAEGREALARLAHAANRHGVDARVVLPAAQRVGQQSDHLQRQGVQRLGAVQRDQAQAAGRALGDDQRRAGRIGVRRVVRRHSQIISKMIAASAHLSGAGGQFGL